MTLTFLNKFNFIDRLTVVFLDYFCSCCNNPSECQCQLSVVYYFRKTSQKMAKHFADTLVLTLYLLTLEKFSI